MERDLFYFLSLPERALRASAVFLGGLVYETTGVLLPGWLRATRLYQAIVAGLLRITIELVGGARGILPEHEVEVQTFAVRKAAGTGIEMAGLLAVGWSPLWIFAVAADLTGGVRTYIDTLVEQLKQDGLLVDDAEIESTKELLFAFEGTTDLVAENIDIPPLSVRDMKDSWQKLKENVRDLPDPSRLDRIYKEFRSVAEHTDSSLDEMSMILGLSAVRAGIKIGNVHIFDFYKSALIEIEREGMKEYTKRLTRPYLAAARAHFAPEKISHTQRLLQSSRLISKNNDRN